MFAIREVLRPWLAGEGLRAIARLARVDRKTVRRYVAAAPASRQHRSDTRPRLRAFYTPPNFANLAAISAVWISGLHAPDGR